MLQDLTSASALYLYPLLAGMCLGVLQIVVYFAGSVSLGDSVADMIEGTGAGEMFDWLNFGRVPFSILCMLLLTTFGVVGMLFDGSIPGLPAWAYAVVAAPAAVGVTKLVGNGIARVLPRDESYAVTRQHMIGRRGIVTLGPLDDGVPGAIRVRDEHGDLHTVKARPADFGAIIGKGTEVVVVSTAPGSDRIFLVIPFTSE